MAFEPHTSRAEIAWHYALRVLVAGVLAFLILPILAVIPLSFTSGSFLSYPLPGLSLRWYHDFFTSAAWLPALRNTLFVGVWVTLLATVLGTLAALGLTRLGPRARSVVAALAISPMVVPAVILGVGLYFLYAPFGMTNSFIGMVLAHTVVATPFVVVTVAATLQGFDTTLARAAAGLGATPLQVFRMVILPIILPGVLSGAVFAFATSFDEIVLGLFLAGPTQRTIPIQMFNGVREEISPTITAAATLLALMSVLLLATIEALRRRGERLTRTQR
jgi:putative spermidine/putrescine transport system permease protein